ncbi:MAG TPA: PqqD family peptide modification chaperone [Acidobacteriaceae bacterium]|nr:PqqD family peptide modification chaperone [Acidobacteriaceae bacterium]
MKEPAIQPDTVVCWSRDAVATDVNGEVVLMNLERDRCYGLGETGSEIWRRIGAPVKVANVIEDLQNEYEAPPGALEADVLETLRQFLEEGLIRIAE